MKINLRKLAVVVALGGLSVGLVGQGVGASSFQKAGVYQKIVGGTMALSVTSGSQTVNATGDSTVTAWLQCGDITVNSSVSPTPSPAVCGANGFTINYTGSVMPTQVVLTPTLVNNTITHLDRFFVDWGAGTTLGSTSGGPTALNGLFPATIPISADGHTGTLSLSELTGGLKITPTLLWGTPTASAALDNSDLGKSVELDLEVEIDG